MSTAVTGLLRPLGAIVIALAFMSILMTASAQQEVLRQLIVVDPKLDYSSAYVIKLQVDQADNDARVAASNEQAANQAVAKASDAFAAAQAGFDDAWQSRLPQIRKLSRSDGCDVDLKEADQADFRPRGQILSTLESCPAGAAALAGQDGGDVTAAYRGLIAANYQLFVAKQRLARAQAVAGALKEDDAKAKQIRDSFDATIKLRSSWYLGGDTLIDFPPALLQIILSFVSGAFGALLLTLVLIVYPNTRIEVASNSAYDARILLGGLIALCVYVVLNGGSAVLGSAASAASGSNNYMTFCAIGILAGMFSDRVAAWLSSRADAFFRPSGGRDGGD